MWRAALFGSIALWTATTGCGHSKEDPPSQTTLNPTDPPEQATDEIDRLRALPYAGYVDVEDDEEVGVVVYDATKSYPGYNLYTMNERSAADLIDARGRVIRSWEHRPGRLWSDGELLPNGDFLAVGADVSELPKPMIADEARYVLRFNWDGELLWKRALTAHHDISTTPDGKLVTLTSQRRRIPDAHAKVPVRDNCITLLAHDGELLESLCLYDVLSAKPERFPLVRVPPDRLGGTPWVDLFHCNSIEWIQRPHLASQHPIYEPGNVLICFRHQDRVAVVNWDTQELVWAWGEGELSGPHDAHLLDNGNILVFDNGLRQKRSRVIELDPRSGEIVWQYQVSKPGTFFTPTKGMNQRLPNGNTLITNSDRGQVLEVTPAGEVVWEFRCPYKNAQGQRATIFGMKRYELGYVERIMEQSDGAEPATP